jgi:hypothetical protein
MPADTPAVLHVSGKSYMFRRVGALFQAPPIPLARRGVQGNAQLGALPAILAGMARMELGTSSTLL